MRRWSGVLVWFFVGALPFACDLQSGGRADGVDASPDVVDEGFVLRDASEADAPLPPEAGPDGDAGPCTSLHGPPMVPVEGYCVDSTEVTQQQYAEFVAAKIPLNGLPPVCNGKSSYADVTDAGPADLPVDYVDWCDAYAFCAWAGKRLCGDIAGGPVTSGATSQWQSACSAKGTQTYCYGSTWDSTKCNVAHDGGLGRTPVGSIKTCEGGYPGLFDMTGNVAEWADKCNGNNCLYYASDYTAKAVNGGCDSQVQVNGKSGYQGVGFRCCSK